MKLSKLRKITSNVLSGKTYSTMPAFFIKSGYKHRTRPEYFDKTKLMPHGITYQPDVYPLTDHLARVFDCKYIIDIGCGDGSKLLASYPRFEIVGIDFKDNLAKCRKDYKFGRWIELDLEKQNPSIDISEDVLKRSAIVCSDVIEHIVNPSNLLEIIKKFLNYSPVCLLSTPECDLTRGKTDLGPPYNRHHIREWSLEEFENLLKHHEFNISFLGLTASDDVDYEKRNILVGLHNNKKIVKDLKDWKISNRKHTSIVSQNN